MSKTETFPFTPHDRSDAHASLETTSKQVRRVAMALGERSLTVAGITDGEAALPIDPKSRNSEVRVGHTGVRADFSHNGPKGYEGPVTRPIDESTHTHFGIKATEGVGSVHVSLSNEPKQRKRAREQGIRTLPQYVSVSTNATPDLGKSWEDIARETDASRRQKGNDASGEPAYEYSVRVKDKGVTHFAYTGSRTTPEEMAQIRSGAARQLMDYHNALIAQELTAKPGVVAAEIITPSSVESPQQPGETAPSRASIINRPPITVTLDSPAAHPEAIAPDAIILRSTSPQYDRFIDTAA